MEAKNWLLTVLVLLSWAQTSTEYMEGVVVLNEDNFEQSIKKFPRLVIYFEEESCHYCQQFKITYAMIAEYFSRYQPGAKEQEELKVQFSKLKLNSQTEHLFKKYGVEAVPSVRTVSNGAIRSLEYSGLDYDSLAVEDLSAWVRRSFTKMQQIEELSELPAVTRNLVCKCGTEAADFLQTKRTTELTVEFFCMKEWSDSDSLVKVFKGKQDSGWFKYNENVSWKSELQASEAVNRDHNFNRFLNQEIIYWNSKSIQKTFMEVQSSSFLLIMNNETKSHKVYESYKKIKLSWHLNNTRPAVPFYVTDLSITPQMTSKIKKFAVGSKICVSKSYPYPVLVYLKTINSEVSKYMFPMEEQLTPEAMTNWMQSVVDILELGQNPQAADAQFARLLGPQGVEGLPENGADFERQANSNSQKSLSERLQVKQHFNEFPEHYFSKEDPLTEEDYEPNFDLKSVSYSDMLKLLSQEYPHQFFVFFGWRNSFKSNILQKELKEWWTSETEEPPAVEQNDAEKGGNDHESKKESQVQGDIDSDLSVNRYSEHSNIWVVNLNFHDYPHSYKDASGREHKIKIQFIPAMLYVGKGKLKQAKIQGIDSLQQVMDFVHGNTEIKRAKQDRDIDPPSEQNQGNNIPGGHEGPQEADVGHQNSQKVKESLKTAEGIGKQLADHQETATDGNAQAEDAKLEQSIVKKEQKSKPEKKETDPLRPASGQGSAEALGKSGTAVQFEEADGIGKGNTEQLKT